MCVEDTERVREEPGREERVREEPGREREEPRREGELVLLGRLHLMLGELKGLDKGLDNTLNLQKEKKKGGLSLCTYPVNRALCHSRTILLFRTNLQCKYLRTFNNNKIALRLNTLVIL